MLVDEIKSMNFETNETEDKLRQIPEIVLHEKMPELHKNMWYIVQTVLNTIFFTLWQRYCASIGSIQLANYNLKDKAQGAFHHDDSSDITVVVPLNTGDYKGGVFHKDALALATMQGIKIETQRDASLRADEIVATAVYGVGELHDS